MSVIQASFERPLETRLLLLLLVGLSFNVVELLGPQKEPPKLVAFPPV